MATVNRFACKLTCSSQQRHTRNCPHKPHKLSRQFNGHFPRRPALSSSRMSPFWILLELRVMGGGGGNWSYKTCKAPSKLWTPTPSFSQFGCVSFLSRNQKCHSRKKMPH